ncbi:alanine racemase [Clostridium sp. MSJ-4]|uniref:Alanine racemase n=1 Tax=Clostridium simiarum TaxID=2841506 RepID=A0ABS6F257_9CLOT|nr:MULTISPECIES: alanine racemase [Clostridium]MBU5592573.1 alanine racemase [Clostridium simiarum]
MFKSIRPVWVEINLDNLSYNLRQVRKITKDKEIIAVIKADAYGHGALGLVHTLLEEKVKRLGVAIITEAMELRRGGVQAPIMILGYTPLTFAKELIGYDIEQTVYSYEYAEELSKEAKKYNKKAKIHIALDTGMGRIGFLPNEESLQWVYKISKLPNISIEGLFSHFSSADEKDKEYTYLQLKKFNWFCEKLECMGVNVGVKHIANSAATIELPDTHFDAVRLGMIMYGYYPSKEVDKTNIDLKPVMTIKTNIIHVKTLLSGEYISYGRRFQTERESIIATLPVGYADGYNSLLFNKGKVIINGKLAPVVGRICMDQCMVDVTDIESVNVGDEVIIMGSQGGAKFDAEDIAEAIGTINYEVMCMISKRVPRVYIKNGEVIKIRNYI